MVPGLLTIERPTRAAKPDRGCTKPTIPNGIATAMPVPTSVLHPGSITTSWALNRSTPASPAWARAGKGSSGSRRTTASLVEVSDEAEGVDTSAQTTLGPVTSSSSNTVGVRYTERLWVPWWWILPGAVVAVLVGLEVNRSVEHLAGWVPYPILFAIVIGVLLWFSRIRIAVTMGSEGQVELRAGSAHLPVSVIARSAAIPSTAKSAALGRQLDPAAFVIHRAWVGPMILVVLEDPDDPTPYWLVSTRHPDQLLAALRS